MAWEFNLGLIVPKERQWPQARSSTVDVCGEHVRLQAGQMARTARSGQVFRTQIFGPLIRGRP